VVKVTVPVDTIMASQARLPKIKQVCLGKGWVECAMAIDAGL